MSDEPQAPHIAAQQQTETESAPEVVPRPLAGHAAPLRCRHCHTGHLFEIDNPYCASCSIRYRLDGLWTSIGSGPMGG